MTHNLINSGDANLLIDNIITRYQQCSTYQDEGSVTGKAGVTLFRTFFKRPLKFRFEWGEETEEASLIVSDGKTVYEKLPGEKAKQVKTMPFVSVATMDVAKAIAMNSGASQGAADMIASLIFQNVGVRKMVELKPFVSRDDDTVIERDCYRIRADWRPMCSTELWISKENMIICQVATEYTQTPEEKAQLVARLEKTDPHRADGMFMKPPETAQKLYVFHHCAFDATIGDEMFTV